MDYEASKKVAAEAALAFVEPGAVLGVGAGTTVEHFIRALGRSDRRPRAAVAASDRTYALLEAHGIAVVGLAGDMLPLPVYVDGADEADSSLRLIKGGGGALTREKIIAKAASRFVCIVDEGKMVARLGTFPVAVEVIPMALHLVEHEIRMLGGAPTLREEYETDNGNMVVDVRALDFADPEGLEDRIDRIPGVVECGIFARRPADILLVGTPRGVRRLERHTG